MWEETFRVQYFDKSIKVRVSLSLNKNEDGFEIDHIDKVDEYGTPYDMKELKDAVNYELGILFNVDGFSYRYKWECAKLARRTEV